MAKFKKATTLKSMRINEISLVDSPANPGANVLLCKRNKTPKSQGNEGTTLEKGNPDMPNNTASPEAIAKLQKKLDAAVAENTALVEKNKGRKQIIKELKEELVLAKLAPEDREYAATLSKDDANAFANMSDDDKKKKKADQPIDKNLPPHIQAVIKQNAEMAEQLAKAQAEKVAESFAKRSTDVGQPAAFGETLQKAYGGDAEAQKAIETVIKALHAQVKEAGLFKNLGTDLGGSADSAVAQVNAIAADMVSKGIVKSIPSAISKMSGMAEHRDLWNRYKAESVN